MPHVAKQRCNVLVTETFGDDPFSGVPPLTLRAHTLVCSDLLLAYQHHASKRQPQKTCHL